ncbi:MAG: cation:proton antiporter [Muribaculaceae bacterium]
MSIESLIFDLAFILLLGAVVTVLFKWLRQPVVLGYIVAGFLASPNFTYLPSVTTEENIEFWAQIGIVALLFSLGLEFSFKKLMRSGGSAVVTALIIVIGMMGVGFATGKLLHFNNINSLFLGGMLSMSSTTIIIKAFTDMGLRQQKFATLVLAVLIVEDLFAVVMMVLLSSIALNNSVEGGEMLWSISKLAFFLIIWFIVGVFMLPTILRSIRRYLNGETLLVVSMGLCLGMAVFSVYCGFSLALGAFVMGSILAGTIYAEKIEHVVEPIKNLFGSVFFISVGMMVKPDILAHYWLPILILSLVVIVGMIVFGSAGMLITGQSLRIAVRSGFSLTQIGEFAFIIATLGLSLHVLEPNIYPIVVAVSVITTFTTPYFIRLSAPSCDLIERFLPERFRFLIDRYNSEGQKEEAAGHRWFIILRRHLWRTAVYTIILIAIGLCISLYAEPWIYAHCGRWSDIILVASGLAVMSPFIIALTMPVRASKHDTDGHNIPRTVLMVFRYIIAVGAIAFIVGEAFSATTAFITAMAISIVVLVVLYRYIALRLRRIESTFFDNLNERELRRSGKNNTVVSDLHLAYITIGPACPFAGERLMNSNLRKQYGVNVVSIQRDFRTIPIPNGQRRIYPGDVIGVIGTDAQIAALLPIAEAQLTAEADIVPDEVTLSSILLSFNSPLINHTPSSASIRDKYNVIVVAVNRNGEFIDSNPNLVFAPGDIVWLAGAARDISRLK